MVNPPSGTSIHPRDWMLVQRTELRVRCLELAQRQLPTASPEELELFADRYYAWARTDEGWVDA